MLCLLISQSYKSVPRQCIGYNLMRMEAKVTCFKVGISCFPLVHATENLLQVMFVHLLRSYKLESVEELPKKPVLGKDSFLMPEGLDKITLVKRVDN